MKALNILKLERRNLDRFIGDMAREYSYKVDEAIKELKDLQNRNCGNCYYGLSYIGTSRKWCEAGIKQDGMTTVDKDFSCSRWEAK